MGKNWVKTRRERYAKRRQLLISKFGKNCYFCNAKENERRLAFHNKLNESHKDFKDMSEVDFKKVIESDDYIRLCYACHKHIHWCMEKLHMFWNEIISLR